MKIGSMVFRKESTSAWRGDAEPDEAPELIDHLRGARMPARQERVVAAASASPI